MERGCLKQGPKYQERIKEAFKLFKIAIIPHGNHQAN